MNVLQNFAHMIAKYPVVHITHTQLYLFLRLLSSCHKKALTSELELLTFALHVPTSLSPVAIVEGYPYTGLLVALRTTCLCKSICHSLYQSQLNRN